MSELCRNAIKLGSMLLGVNFPLANCVWAQPRLAPQAVADKSVPSAINRLNSSLKSTNYYNKAHTINLPNRTLDQTAQGSQVPTAPSAQITTASQLSKVSSVGLNPVEPLIKQVSQLQHNSRYLPLEPVTETATLWLTQVDSKPEPKARPQKSYIGIGGDIGLSGNRTALGSGGLAILSNTRFTDNLSLHGATVVFGSRTATSTYALTIGTPIKAFENVVFPFLGGGVMLRNTGSLKVAPLLSVSVDVPIGRNFTATARVNVGFPSDQTDVGLAIGIGYNFSIFSLFGGK